MVRWIPILLAVCMVAAVQPKNETGDDTEKVPDQTPDEYQTASLRYVSDHLDG